MLEIIVPTSIIALLTAFILGFIMGKRRGKAKGFAEGKAVVPLLLRQCSLEKGYCVLCGQTGPLNCSVNSASDRMEA